MLRLLSGRAVSGLSRCSSRDVVAASLEGQARGFSTSTPTCQAADSDGAARYNRPVTASELPRSAGIATMFRLPHQTSAQGLDACFLGIPYDNGASNRTGTRFGPRKIRSESVLIRVFNQETGADPYHSIQTADVGDVNMRMFNIKDTCEDIRNKLREIIADGCRPLIAGGDHTVTYPILQAMKEKYGPVALVHVDAHADTFGPLKGSDIWHGNPFRLAVEEGLLECSKVWQIGLRGSGHSVEDAKWGMDRGFHAIPAYQCWHTSLLPLMATIRQDIGPDIPVYISFDIDGIDPAFAPGTGTPEVGGLTSQQALEIIRGCRGLNIVGGDLVEVAPVYDKDDVTSLLAANLLFEMLCVLPGVKYRETAYLHKFTI